MSQKVTTAFQLYCNTGQDGEAGVFFAHCPSLGIFSQGLAVDQANAALLEAIDMTIKHWYKLGQLEDFLLNKGFTRSDAALDLSSARTQDEFIAIHDDSDSLYSIPSAFLTHSSEILSE